MVPLYTATLTSGHPSYTARFNRHGRFSLYIYPSPTATSLTRPAATVLESQSQHLPLTNGPFSFFQVCKLRPLAAPLAAPSPYTHTQLRFDISAHYV